MMPEVPVRIAIFGHAISRQENNNTFRFGKGETLATSNSRKKEEGCPIHPHGNGFIQTKAQNLERAYRGFWALRLSWFMVYRTRNITFGVCLSWFLRLCWFMVYRTREYYSWGAPLLPCGSYGSNESYRIVPWCNNEMHAPYVLRTRTVSNAHGLYGVYDRSTALYGESPNAAVSEMTGGRGCLLKLLPSLYAILFRYYPSTVCS